MSIISFNICFFVELQTRAVLILVCLVFFVQINIWFFLINREMSWWSSNQSNMINGTDGAVFHPLINRNELLYIFAADLCRCASLCGFKFVYRQSTRWGEDKNFNRD